jgi:hypothetical protein
MRRETGRHQDNFCQNALFFQIGDEIPQISETRTTAIRSKDARGFILSVHVQVVPVIVRITSSSRKKDRLKRPPAPSERQLAKDCASNEDAVCVR